MASAALYEMRAGIPMFTVVLNGKSFLFTRVTTKSMYRKMAAYMGSNGNDNGGKKILSRKF